jgi:adenylate cyclase
MSAEKDAEDIMDILNAYFSILIPIICQYDGTIDKFIGDEILAVFGSPEPDAKQHEKAVRAAWEMQAAMNTLNGERKARGQVTCHIGIGIHCGEVLHGFIGSAERIEFTVIGDAVNRASRYCDGAGAGEVLISPEVYQRVWEIVKEERTTTETKHEGTLSAHRIKNVDLR